LFKTNWKDIEPKPSHNDTCYVRDYFSRRDNLCFDGGYKVTRYLEWVKHFTIPSETSLLYHMQNVEEVLYILQGEGLVQAGGTKHEVKAWDTVYIPTGTPHTTYSTVENQPLVYMSYAVRTPPDSQETYLKETVMDDRVHSDVLVGRWNLKKTKPEHNNTCWTYPVFTRDMMQYLLFATMMSVPKILGYHRHNSESIYYVDSGKGFVKVGGEESEVQAGDAVYILEEIAHNCRSSLKEQPLNIFCVGVAVPYNAKVWTQEDLPDISV